MHARCFTVSQWTWDSHKYVVLNTHYKLTKTYQNFYTGGGGLLLMAKTPKILMEMISLSPEEGHVKIWTL